jgi:hypothetical protein
MTNPTVTTVSESNGARHYSYTLKREYGYMSPSSFHAPLPPNVALDATDGPGAVAALVARAKAASPRVNDRVYTPLTYVVGPEQPLVPVYCPSGYRPKVALFQWYGVPIDVDLYLQQRQERLDYIAAKGGSDTDRSCVVTQRMWSSFDNQLFDREWGMWRLDPTTPDEQIATGCRLKMNDGGCYRIVGLDASLGYTVARPHVSAGKLVPLDQPGWLRSWGPGYVDGDSPNLGETDKLSTWELRSGFQLMSASGLAIGPFVTRLEDRDSIEHVTSFGIGADLVRKGARYPAQASDGGLTTAPLQEGMRFQLDPAVDVDSLGMNKLGAMYAKAWQKYGVILIDKSGNGSSFATSGEYKLSERDDIAPLIGHGIRSGAKGELLCFDGLPWDRMRLIAPGTVAQPIPVTA